MDATKDMIVREFINIIIPCEIGISLKEEPKKVIDSNSYTKKISAALKSFELNLKAATNAVINKLIQDVTINNIFARHQQFQNYQQFQQEYHNSSNSDNFQKKHLEVQNAYKILEVQENCANAELKSAHRKLVMKYHPDKNPSEEAKQKMAQINAAYDLIKKERNI